MVHQAAKDKFFIFYKICLFFFFINSMHPWFLLRIPSVWISLIFFSVSMVAFNKNYFYKNIRKGVVFCFFLMFMWIKKDGNFFGLAEGLLNAIIFGMILNLKAELMVDSLNFITKWLALIVLVSGVFYILFLLGVNLPHTTLSLSENARKDGLENYYFFVFAYEMFGMTRFYSIFLEPGYLTLGVAPLLFIYKYDVKNKYILLLLLSQLLSFSLAGLILLFFGFFYCTLCGKEKGKLKKIMGGILVLLLGFIALYNLLGYEYFYNTIFSRLIIENGTLSGDDRSSLYLDSVYDSMMKTSSLWTGTYFDVSFSEKGVSGYKLFAVQNGIIGVALVVMAYISLVDIKNIGFNYLTGFIILCLLLLYQNSYPESMCILFTGACAIYMLDTQNYRKSLNIGNR